MIFPICRRCFGQVETGADETQACGVRPAGKNVCAQMKEALYRCSAVQGQGEREVIPKEGSRGKGGVGGALNLGIRISSFVLSATCLFVSHSYSYEMKGAD